MPILPFRPSQAAIRALDALIAREPWARERLRPHAGKRARIELGALRLDVAVGEDGGVAVADAEVAPDVVLTVAPDRLPQLMSADTSVRMSAVRIVGDAALAHVIGDLARDLRWDAEDELAGWLGDVPAARLSATAGAVWRGLRDGAWRMAGNAAEFLTEERGVLPTQPALQAWQDEVRRVRDDVERVAKRVARAEAALSRLEAAGGRERA